MEKRLFAFYVYMYVMKSLFGIFFEGGVNFNFNIKTMPY